MNLPCAKAPYDFTEQDIYWFANWVYQKMGIYYGESKYDILKLRLESLALSLGLPNVQSLRECIEYRNVPDIYSRVAEVVTTNHTHFFREMDPLNYFEHTIVESFARTNIRIWSAASSSGEELYTLALILIKKYGFNDAYIRFSLLGTDINTRVIAEAEQGIYLDRSIENVPNDLIGQWFKPIGLDHWEIKAEVKQMCIFRRLNLMSSPWPFSKLFHVIFLRNVLYYFDSQTQRKILLKMYDSIENDGWLVTSVTESVTELDVPWRKIRAGIYRKLT